MATMLVEEAKSYAIEVEAVLREEAVEVFETCKQCGICLGVCPTYRATQNPYYSPPRRLLIARRILAGSPAREDDVKILFSCLLCGLCSYACPYHLPVWRTILVARHELAKRGMLPRGLKEVTRNAERIGHSFTTSPEHALKWIKLVDRRRIDSAAKVLFIPSPLEGVRFPRKILVKLQLFSLLGVDYTVTKKVLDVGGNAGLDASRIDIGLSLLLGAYHVLEDSGSEYLVISECGSDVKIVKTLLPIIARKAGINQHRILHLYDILVNKRLRDHREEGRAVLFTSCNFCRLTTLCPRLLTSANMPPDPPPYTSCCGGGGGMSINTEDWAVSIRRKIAIRRAAVLQSKLVLVPCIKCYVTLQEAYLLQRMRDKRVMLVSEALLQLVRGKEK